MLSPTLIAGGVGVTLFLGSLAYGQWERAGRIQAENQVSTLETRLSDTRTLLEAERRDRDSIVSALSDVTRAARESAQNLQAARNAAYAAPPSNTCVVHPGVRALRDSLYARDSQAPARPTANPGGSP